MLSDVEIFQIKYARNSVTVDIDRSFSWINIESVFSGESIFLQGAEAEKFIEEYDKNCLTFPNVDCEDLEFLTVYPYCDMFN